MFGVFGYQYSVNVFKARRESLVDKHTRRSEEHIAHAVLRPAGLWKIAVNLGVCLLLLWEQGCPTIDLIQILEKKS